MRTVSGQLFEIVAKEVEVLAWIRSGVWDDDLAYEKTFPTLAAWRAEMDTVRTETFAFIDSMSETELVRPVSNPNLWQEALNLPECPVAEVIGFIPVHEWYHTGQLVAYVWSRGDDPYRW